MTAHVEKLTNFEYAERTFDILWVVLDEQRSPPILPLLYTTYLSQYGIVYESKELSNITSRKRISSLNERYISDSTIRSYIYNLAKFFNISRILPHHSPNTWDACVLYLQRTFREPLLE